MYTLIERGRFPRARRRYMSFPYTNTYIYRKITRKKGGCRAYQNIMLSFMRRHLNAARRHRARCHYESEQINVQIV